MDLIFFLNQILHLLLDLSADPNLPRSVVDTVMTFFDDFNKTYFIPSLQSDIMKILEKEKLSNQTKIALKSIFDDYKLVYTPLNTETKRFNLFQNVGYRNPEIVEIANVLLPIRIGNKIKLSFDVVYALWSPLRYLFKTFLEIPGVFNSILEYRKKLLSDKNAIILRNIIQADLFQQKYNSLLDQDIFPYLIYFDECECGNPLGSCAGKHKFSTIYAQIACLPPDIASRVSTIFLSMLMHSSDQKLLKNSQTFNKLIEEANYIRKHGIEINVGSKTYRIKFQLILIIGDNLGLNEIFGFTQSFTTDFYCRICKMTHQECCQATVEDVSKIRNRIVYDIDAKVPDVHTSGLRESCVFNRIIDFHIADSSSIDILHDFLEGVCSYDIHEILNCLIFKKKIFTLERLNSRIQKFEYRYTGCNKPPVIKEHHLKQRSNLKMSGSEVSCLTRYLPVMMGDLVEEDDEHWNLLILLRKIYAILTCHFVRRDIIDYLKQLISEHHELYIELFGDLKPKYHFLLHYPRLLLLLGPCVNFSTMRFESRHRQIKSVVTSTSSRVNTLKTIGVKEQLHLCKTTNELKKDKNEPIDSYKTHTKILLNGVTYEIGMILPIDIRQHDKIFGKIVSIIQVKSKIYFTMECYEEEDFDYHYFAYTVNRNSNRDLSINYKNLCSITSGILILKNTGQESENFVCFPCTL
ncbi:hypothetical protein TKK_0008039 [Trichogramma kaykai]|uniref:Uncharacterized protein n=1 Tax=Trichogramma kaykai TaxID=54128 RepID=A0ABD2X730_9HYME